MTHFESSPLGNTARDDGKNVSRFCHSTFIFLDSVRIMTVNPETQREGWWEKNAENREARVDGESLAVESKWPTANPQKGARVKRARWKDG